MEKEQLIARESSEGSSLSDQDLFEYMEWKRSTSTSAASKRMWLLASVTIFNMILFLTSCLFWSQWISHNKGQNANWKATSLYSPIFDKGFSLDLDESTKNHTLWGSDEVSEIYIQDPSPTVDAAWDYISADDGHIITISGEEARKLGRDTNVIVKAPLDWGFGDDAYPAQIDMFHEIHCVDVLRKEMYWDYYYGKKYGTREKANEDYLHTRHVKHCLRIVLRTVMCAGDVNIVTHNWRRGSYRPISDFDNPRQCRNFEAIRDWNMAHRVVDDMAKWRSIKRPTDATILPKPTPNLYTSEDNYEWINNL